MTRPHFDQAMGRLLALRFPPASIDSHYDALKDIPADVFDAAISHALKTRTVFPVPAELRADADHVFASVRPMPPNDDGLRTRTLETPRILTFSRDDFTLRLPVTGEYTYDCEACSDTGWESFWCGADAERRAAWVELRNCDRHGAHGSHEWARRCGCYETNPTLVRKRAARQKFADAPQRAS